MISKADIKYIVSLQLKKQRQKYGQFIVEGEKSIKELLKSRFKIDRVYATTQYLETNPLSFKNIKVIPIDEKELAAISVHQTPQQLLALIDIPQNKLSGSDVDHGLILGLDNLQDPGNLGTIIRIADWYGISTIICSPDCTDVYNPKCINSTMGSIARVNVFYDDIAKVADSFNLPLIAATLNGDNLHKMKAAPKGVLLIGNEGHGISDELLKKAKHCITIPKLGGAESLNAAVSAAIIIDNLMQKG